MRFTGARRRLILAGTLVFACTPGPAQDDPGASFDAVLLGEVGTVESTARLAIEGRRDAAPSPGLAEAVQAAGWLDPDLTFVMGNLVCAPASVETWNELLDIQKAALDRLGSPWHAVAGRTEFLGGAAARGAAYSERLGAPWYAVEHRFACFLVMCTSEPAFRGGAADGELSREQLEWLGDTLAASDARQIVVLMHRALWLETPGAWEPVHALLESDGREVSVFASSPRSYRDAGHRGRVRYLTLGPVWGDNGLAGSDAYSWPHLTLLRVRPTGVTPVIVPMRPDGSMVGLRPGDWQTGEEVGALEALATMPWATTEGRVRAGEGGFDGAFVVHLTNPRAEAVRFAVNTASASGAAYSPSAITGTIEPGQRAAVTVRASGGSASAQRPADEVRASIDVPLRNGRVQSLVRSLPVPVVPGGGAGEASSDPAWNGVLSLGGRSAVEADVPAPAAFTIEGWVRAQRPRAESVLFGFADGASVRWAYDAQGEPRVTGVVFLEGAEVTVPTAGDWAWDRWSHVALTCDGKVARLFVNGSLQSERAIDGAVRELASPFVIGARGVGRGRFLDWFEGAVDEVRVSSVARYERDFVPERVAASDDQTLALYHFDEPEGRPALDASGSGRHGWTLGSAAVVIEPIE